MFIKSNSEVHCLISVLELCVCDQNKSLNPFALWQSFSAMIFTLPIQYYLLLFILFFYLFWLFCHFWSFEFRSFFKKKKQKTKKQQVCYMMHEWSWCRERQHFFPMGTSLSSHFQLFTFIGCNDLPYVTVVLLRCTLNGVQQTPNIIGICVVAGCLIILLNMKRHVHLMWCLWCSSQRFCCTHQCLACSTSSPSLWESSQSDHVEPLHTS